MSDELLFEVKLLLVGDANVGKSCLVQRYTIDQYEHNNSATVGSLIQTTSAVTGLVPSGVDFMIKFLRIEGQRLKLKIWDTAGNERFRALTRAYYKDTHGVLLVYDVTRRETLEHLSSIWMEEVAYSNTVNDAIKILIGNKKDMARERVITTEEGRSFAEQNGCLFIETSAKENIDVEAAFKLLAEKIFATPSLMTDIRQASRLRLKRRNTKKQGTCC